MSESLGVRLISAVVLLAVAVAGSFVTSTWVASRAYVRRGEQDTHASRTLEVVGSAKRRIVSDLGIWPIHVAGEGKTLEEAYERLNASVTAVQGFLSKQGFGGESIALGAINTVAHHRRDEKGNELREVVSYALSRGFTLRSADVAKVVKAAGEVTELIKAGAHVESGAPQFIFTRLQDLKVEMLGEATRNARERAELIATESRCRIGAVKDARAAALQITPPWSTEVSSGGMNDTTSIEKDITSIVHLTVQIEAP
jgi:hypothetical protein